MDKNTVLKQHFGYDAFRDGQEQIITSLLDGRDVLGVMPTGGGKSICYQLPALMLPGVTLVISPLISLMNDQVAALKDVGVSAAFINSSLSSAQLQTVYKRLGEGLYKIVYVAPERLEGEGFVSLMQRLSPSLIAVDEAHCISRWGQDFRPSYLKIAEFLSKLHKRPPVAALTATATQEVRLDIIRSLGLYDPFCIVTGFDRPNLYFDVLRPKNKLSTLKALLADRRDKSGIIYCSTRKAVDQLYSQLCELGIAAARYHAGLPDTQRQENQNDFQYDRRTVMVATNAFGMGIDKSNVSFVIHYNMPKDIESYYQEAGRAGRDGAAADCVLLYSAGDVQTAKFLIENGKDNDTADLEARLQSTRRDLARLDKMILYCKSSSCLRKYILDYFGQAAMERCGNCGSCRTSFSLVDVTSQAQMILSCVKRARAHLGYGVGAALIIKVLRGAKDKRVLEMGLNRLSTYGLMSGVSQERVREYIEWLETGGYLCTNPTHSTLELTSRSAEVLFDGKALEMPLQERHEPVEKKGALSFAKPKNGDDSELYALLKSVRTRLAAEERVPAYIVFSNATLTDMAEKMPQSTAELLEVSGVGEKKSEKYGQYFLDAVKDFLRENESPML